MPTLQLLRHAKSAWPPGVADYSRPLNDRGRRDAPVAGQLLARRGEIGLALVSPAARTRETFDLVSAELPVAPEVTFDPRIYDAGLGSLLEVLSEVPAGVDQVLLVGHNPGVEMLAWHLGGDDDTDAGDAMRRKYPTAGLAEIELQVPWSELAVRAGFGAVAVGTLQSFVVPRG